MTRSAGPASTLKVSAWLSRGKWNPPLVFNPLDDFASGKSQIFTELEMWDTFDSTTPCSFVHPGARDAQYASDIPHGQEACKSELGIEMWRCRRSGSIV